MLYTRVRFQIPPTTGGTTRHDITLYLWHDLTCCYSEYESRRMKIHAQAILIPLESWHGGSIYPSRLSWNSTIPTDNSWCNYINQVAVCTPDKTSFNKKKKQCPPYANSALHSTFPPTTIFTTSFNIILSRFGACVCDVDIVHVVVQQTVSRNSFSRNVPYRPLTNNTIQKGQSCHCTGRKCILGKQRYV